jgi:uncharacterized protein
VQQWVEFRRRMATSTTALARRRGRGLRILFVSVLTIFTLWVTASWIGERAVLHPARWGDGPTPAAHGWAYRDVSFRDRDGVVLRGWWIPGAGNRTIVMVHGWTSSRREPLDKAGYLHDAGYNLLVFDLRGHGTSGGTFTTMGLKEPADVQAAVTEALSLAPGPIALFGYSMGASTVLEEAASDPRIAAVIEDSGYATLADVLSYGFHRVTGLPAFPFDSALLTIAAFDVHLDLSRVQPIRDAARLQRPLLVIVGTADHMVPPADGLAIFRAASGPKQLLVIPNAGHVAGFWVARALYETTVLNFLRSSLG